MSEELQKLQGAIQMCEVCLDIVGDKPIVLKKDHVVIQAFQWLSAIHNGLAEQLKKVQDAEAKPEVAK